ncbi:phage tail assembly chaperone [Planococcus faecalis]|uniref:Uncharacterized protein n=1 Tax=Planococcus faecalis TaxID=1598147 RepID=A0ABM6ITP1_9BACL|nr:hypothetical protein [Planococcus faecalis]AQU79717.1 hypothetical protein AJGP001_10775 [Planococcus faecalis]OHX55296.1 hypothetical protein BB777_04450 [Planococcus faecalis]
MENKGLEKWFQRDVRPVGELELPSAGITVELRALDWKTVNNIRKKNSHTNKSGVLVRNEDGLPMDMIATAIQKINGTPFNFYDKEVLSRLGAKTHEEAINSRFLVSEVAMLLKKINELGSNTAEAEDKEIEELKN